MSRLNTTKPNLWMLGIGLLLLGACNPQQKKEAVTKEAVEEVDAPKEIITLDEAKELCENYENRRIPNIKAFETAQNESEEFVPTQFIDFDFKTIKRYMKYVERSARKAGIKPDSLRIYLGNYGKEGKDPNRNTVFLVPTANINGENGGFYINDKGEAELIRNYWPKTGENGNQEGGPKSKASFMPNFTTSLIWSGGSKAMNRGQSGPPPTGDF